MVSIDFIVLSKVGIRFAIISFFQILKKIFTVRLIGKCFLPNCFNLLITKKIAIAARVSVHNLLYLTGFVIARYLSTQITGRFITDALPAV